MSITASCRHTLREEDEGFIVRLPSFYQDKPAIAHCILCRDCYEFYKNAKMIMTDEQVKEYLAGDIKYKACF